MSSVATSLFPDRLMCVWGSCSFVLCKPQRRRTVHYGLCPREHAFALFITMPSGILAFSGDLTISKHIDCNRIVKVNINKAQLLVRYISTNKKTSP